MKRQRAVWSVTDIDYIHYEYKYEDTGTGPALQARHGHLAAMLRTLLLLLLPTTATTYYCYYMQ